jgi:hypothetical protein
MESIDFRDYADYWLPCNPGCQVCDVCKEIIMTTHPLCLVLLDVACLFSACYQQGQLEYSGVACVGLLQQQCAGFMQMALEMMDHFRACTGVSCCTLATPQVS